MSTHSAVVTGAGRGIGRATAAALVARGYAVVVTDLDADAARRTASTIGAAAGVGQDVRDEASHRLVADEAARHGELRVWVNNAGVGYDGTLAGLPSEQLDALVDVNLKGMLWGMRAAFAAFGSPGEDAWGDVVNIGSMSAFGPVPGLAVYAATKAAIVSATMTASLETPDNVRVHTVCPDGVDTDLLNGMDSAGAGKALAHSGGRVLTVDEVAEAVAGMIGSRRVVRAVPAWRGGVARASAFMPSRGAGAVAVAERFGRWTMNRPR